MAGENSPYTTLDASQVIRQAFDETKDRLRVDTEATITATGQIEVAISQEDDSIRIGDGTNLITATVNGATVALDVNIANSNLNIGVDGVYDGLLNPNPDNIGLIASERNASPSDSTQTVRITSVNNGTINALDIALLDNTGTPYSTSNPLQVSVNNSSSVGSVTTPSITNVSSQILAANSNRKYVYIYNNSPETMHLQLGQSAVFGRGIKLESNSMFEITIDTLWLGSIHAIKSTALPELLDVFEAT